MSKFHIYELDDDDDCSIEEFLDSKDTFEDAVRRMRELQKGRAPYTVFLREVNE